jgi:hypothetical protein
MLLPGQASLIRCLGYPPRGLWSFALDLSIGPSMNEPLAREAQVFAERVEDWRQTQLGKYVVIKGDDVVGFYASLEQAFRVGTEKFGLEPFLVRQIVPTDVVNVSLYGRRLHVA